MVQQLKSRFKVFYMDDSTLGGNSYEVLEDFKMVETFAKDLGLQLNCTKSELICSNSSVLEVMAREVPGLQERDPDSAELLDSPIGGIEAINTTIRAKIGKLQLLGDRLCLLHSHDALFLLRHSFTIPKMLYVLRTAPCFLSLFLDSLF